MNLSPVVMTTSIRFDANKLSTANIDQSIRARIAALRVRQEW